MSTSRGSVSSSAAAADEEDDDDERIDSRDRSSTGRAKANARFVRSKKNARPSSLKTEAGRDPLDNGNGSTGSPMNIEGEISESVDGTSELVTHQMEKMSLNDDLIADGDENRSRETERSAPVTKKVTPDSHRRTELPGCSNGNSNVAERSRDSRRVVVRVEQRKTEADREKAREEKRLAKAVEKFSKKFVKSAITLGIIERDSTTSSGSSSDDTSTTSCSCSDCCPDDTSSCSCSECNRSSSSSDSCSCSSSSSSSSKSSDTDDADSSSDHTDHSEDSSTSTTVD